MSADASSSTAWSRQDERHQVGLARRRRRRTPAPGAPRASGSPRSRKKPSSVTSAHSRPLPPNQRWCGIHSRSRSLSAVIESRLAVSRLGLAGVADHARRPAGRRRPRSRSPVAGSSWPCLDRLGRLGQLEPVEAVPGEGEQVGQLADPRELDPAGQLDRRVALEPAQVELDRLREPGQVVDAQHDVVAELAHEGQHGRVARARCR